MKTIYQTLASALVFGVMTSNGLSDPKPERAQLTGAWSSSTSVTLSSPEGPIQAVAKQTQVTSTNPTGSSKPLPVEVVVVPSKQLYWVGLAGKLTYFVLENRIVAVRGEVNDRLLFYPSADHMARADDENVIQNTLSAKVANFAADHLEYKPVGIKLEQYLGFFPFTKTPTAMLTPAPKIEGVSVGTGNFSVSLSGGKDYKVKAVVTFTDDFTVTQATLDGKQVYPH